MARVAINGDTFTLAMNNPFNAPMVVPNNIPITQATKGLIPIWVNIFAVTTPINESCVPTDKSIPPEIRTKVIPIVIMATTTICLIIVIMLPAVKKTGLPIEKIATNTKRTRIIPYFLKRTLKSIFFVIMDFLLPPYYHLMMRNKEFLVYQNLRAQI